jgi:protein-tyrosine phosphatase
MVLSLLTDQEVVELVLGSEADSRRRAGVEFVRFPIEDRGVPDSIEATGRLLDRLEQELRDQKTIALHCRVGLGRLALLTACLLVRSGLELDAAWAAITVSRGVSVPDTPEQRQWPARFARGSRAC